MRPRPLVPFIALLTALTACMHDGPTRLAAMREGPWRMELDMRTNWDQHAVILPFLFDLHTDSGHVHLLVHNGSEKIAVDDIVLHGDSVNVRMPLFDSEFLGVLQGDSLYTGMWHNYLKGPDYMIPFKATAGRQARFALPADGTADVTGDWETHFNGATEDAYAAVGMFHAANGVVTGTFATETGDYRFLEGVMHKDSLFLSAFDGTHAFLFTAQLHHDSLIGSFRSGIHAQEPWAAVRNPAFQLRDPDSLTFLKEGYNMVDFKLPSIDGDTVSPMDPRFRGHVRLVQIMGSWCPNCMDETVMLNEMYAAHHDQGLDVMAVAFERYPEKDRAYQALRHYRDALHVKYDVLYAGVYCPALSGGPLPFLDKVVGYPTCIFIDRQGKVRRIRTGFYGPGTGDHYVTYKQNVEKFLTQLLAEPAPSSAVAAR